MIKLATRIVSLTLTLIVGSLVLSDELLVMALIASTFVIASTMLAVGRLARNSSSWIDSPTRLAASSPSVTLREGLETSR